MNRSNKYPYLRQDINDGTWLPNPNRNCFSAVNQEMIGIAETRLGFSFPKQLKEFWLEIGQGRLSVAVNSDNAFDYNNIILSPKEIADILILREDSNLIIPEVAENLEEGDVPFFDIGDSASFVFMRLNSIKPNAVYMVRS